MHKFGYIGNSKGRFMVNTINNKAKRNSRERMIRALLGLVQTRKVRDISVSELCELAVVNRTTFYNHYDNIGELAKDARNSIVEEYAKQFRGNTDGYTSANFLIMFRHIYENQILYNTYFRLNPDYHELLGIYDRALAERYHPGQGEDLMRYHTEFFAAGITAIIKRWLLRGCKESPEEMVTVIMSEYRWRGMPR